MAERERQEFISHAVSEGINEILKHHPGFKENAEYIASHIEKRKLNSYISKIYHALVEKNWSNKRKTSYLHRAIASSVASGKLFDEEAQEVILKRGLEERAKTGFLRSLFSGNLRDRIFARQTLEGEKYLDKTLGAFNNLYQLFRSGEYSERMPDVYKAVERVHDLGILNPALDILRYHNLIDERKFRELKGSIFEETRKGVKALGRIEDYISPQEPKEEYMSHNQAAAIIIAAFGMVFIFLSGTAFTSKVISNIPVSGFFTVPLAGISLLLIGCAMFFFKLIRKNLKTKRTLK